MIGLGICVRDDDDGAFVLPKTEWHTPKCDVHVGEALGLLSTLHWIHELGLRPIVLNLIQRRWLI